MRPWLRQHVLTPTGAARFGVTIILTVVALMVAVGLNVAYTNQQQRKICGLITLQDDAYQETPPTTPTGRRVAAELHRYRQQIGC